MNNEELANELHTYKWQTSGIMRGLMNEIESALRTSTRHARPITDSEKGLVEAGFQYVETPTTMKLAWLIARINAVAAERSARESDDDSQRRDVERQWHDDEAADSHE